MTTWMIQDKSDKLPFDLSESKPIVAGISRFDLAVVCSLFNKLGDEVMLDREYDNSLIFQVSNDYFEGFLNTDARITRRTRRYRIPFGLLDATYNNMRQVNAETALVSVADGYLLFSFGGIVGWCKTGVFKKRREDFECSTMACVDGLKLLKALANYKHEEMILISADGRSVWLNDDLFESGLPGERTNRSVATIHRFSLARVLLRVLRWHTGLRDVYLGVSSTGVKLIALDSVFFFKSEPNRSES